MSNNWISVENKLPDNCNDVLVTIGKYDVAIGYYGDIGCFTGKKIWHVEGDHYHDVTAWMPLPKPYKGD